MNYPMPDEFVPVAKAADLLPGQMKWVAVNGEASGSGQC